MHLMDGISYEYKVYWHRLAINLDMMYCIPPPITFSRQVSNIECQILERMIKTTLR